MKESEDAAEDEDTIPDKEHGDDRPLADTLKVPEQKDGDKQCDTDKRGIEDHFYRPEPYPGISGNDFHHALPGIHDDIDRDLEIDSERQNGTAEEQDNHLPGIEIRMYRCGYEHPDINEDPEEQGDKHLEVLLCGERFPKNQDLCKQEQYT